MQLVCRCTLPLAATFSIITRFSCLADKIGIEYSKIVVMFALRQEEGGSKRGPVRWDAELPADLPDLPEPGPANSGGWASAGETPRDSSQTGGGGRESYSNRGTLAPLTVLETFSGAP